MARMPSRKETRRALKDVQDTVRDRSGEVAEKAVAARAWAAPRWSAARLKVADDVVPAITEALSTAVEASKPVRDEAVA
ncbi:MAG TPA: hypothetical protein VIQ02_09365, partial [Jiangellaceae bacterium]